MWIIQVKKLKSKFDCRGLCIWSFYRSEKTGELTRTRIHILLGPFESIDNWVWESIVAKLKCSCILISLECCCLKSKLSTRAKCWFDAFHVVCIDANKSNLLKMYEILSVAYDVKEKLNQMFAIKAKNKKQSQCLVVFISFNELVFIFFLYSSPPIDWLV